MKKKIFSIISRFDIPKSALRDIIINNISDPVFTEICLVASLNLHPKIKSFSENLAIALEVKEKYPEVNVQSAFRICLHKLSIDSWEQNGWNIISYDESKLELMLEMIRDANLDPAIEPLNDDETIIEFIFKWPYRPYYNVSTYSGILTYNQCEIVNSVLNPMPMALGEINLEKQLVYGESHPYIYDGEI